MLTEISGGGAVAAPPPPPLPTPPHSPAAAGKQAVLGDTVAPAPQHSGSSFFGPLWHGATSDLGRAVSSVGTWSEANWGTVAGFGHGLASVPGLVARKWSDASEINAELSSKLGSVTSDWAKTAASARKESIADIAKTAHGESSSAEHAVSMMRDANRVPFFFESNAKLARQAESSIVLVAGTAKVAVGEAVERAPQLMRSPLHRLAEKAEGALAQQFGRVTSAAKEFAADSNRLSHESETSLHAVASDLKDVSANQAANADRFIARNSRLIGTTFFEKSGALEKAPVLRDIPVVGTALTGAGILADAREHGWLDSTAANVAQTVVGTAVTSAVADGLSSFGCAALADGGATALGAVAATGPVGWAFAGGVVVGAVAGYEVYHAIESKEDQHIIAGAELGAEHGFLAAATGVGDFAETSWYGAKSVAHDIGHAFSSII